MEEFSASLVREKITLTEEPQPGAEQKGATVIRSNRVYLQLGGDSAENVVVRAQNMHGAMRLSGKLLYSYFRNGLFLGRPDPFDWDGTWESTVSEYEKAYNPGLWASVYINGKPAFRTATSPFVDVIEKCALLSLDNYAATMGVTEAALRQVGRAMRISHSTNVAAVLSDSGDAVRCGIIMRGRGGDATFNFTAEGGGDPGTRISQAFGVTAAFLEGINLRYVAQGLHAGIKSGEIAKIGREATQQRLATARLTALDKRIGSFEEVYAVKYRPLKPSFFDKT